VAIKMISVCNKGCDFYETFGNQAGCCHKQAVLNSPEDRIIELKNKFVNMRKFNQIDDMFKKFDGGFPAWCPLAREVKNGTVEATSI